MGGYIVWSFSNQLDAYSATVTRLRPRPLRGAADQLRLLPGRLCRLGSSSKRLALGILTLFAVSIVVFAATQALPGNAARAILGKQATPEALAALTRQLHLNEPVFTQYTHWLGGVLTGNLGISAATQQPVTQLLSARIGNSGVPGAGRGARRAAAVDRARRADGGARATSRPTRCSRRRR